MQIDSFHGEFRYLSNFWPCEVHYRGRKFPSAENAYQAAKCADFLHHYKTFQTCTPSESKRRGQIVEMSSTFHDDRVQIMYEIVKDKFTRNKDLGEALCRTYPMELIEGNDWGDRFWGAVMKYEKLEGLNHLGKILMRVRDEIRANT